MNGELQADAYRHHVYRPHPVSDERSVALDRAVTVPVVVMSLGPLSAYANLGG